MASPSYAIHRIRKVHRAIEESEDSDQIDFREEYRKILQAIHQHADEETHDDLMGWVIVETVHSQDLPDPADLRDRARDLCRYRGITIPPDSPLQR
ncbi:hypothetical protein K0C01_03915 [Salinarchaeum sp. IM2453]|uniref:hypothetical protein n=1 Tax=Salinarchaeum sp. IM2453 TaxID=2862870 RepID=UPI001C839677|nr:hypothetical protein [Salinarchaeum sp. IM2453]QZA89300.1 hypothetical protein K0C01_03915 [Salinarchaeum sp. IM2453]